MLRFADIPQPTRVRALPTTHSGMPVPYTTRYHDENNKDLSSVAEHDGAHIMRCECKLGEGRPKIGKPCAHRQRRAMVERRCVVCGRRLSDRALLVFLGVATGHIEHRPSLYAVEPPAHPECAAYSALACPRLAHGDDVHVAFTRHYEVWKELYVPGLGHKDLKPVDAPTPYGTVVDLYCAIIDVGHARVVPLRHWMATEAPKTYRNLAAQNGTCPA